MENLTAEDELDMALAAELQAALLPRRCPTDYPHQRAAARNRMYGAVGGDFYDFIRINADQIAVVIGDVVGHGVRASLIMAQIMGYLRSGPEDISRPSRAVGAMNRMLIELGEKIGAVLPSSLFYAVMDAPSGLALFVNAGHPRPYLCDRSAATAEPLGSHDLLLGIEEYEPVEMCHTFTRGERLALYTDGVSDAVNGEGECFGQRRLQALIARHSGQEPEAAAEAVIAEVERFRQGARQRDDESVVIIDRV